MDAIEQVQKLWSNLLQLGGRRLAALAAIGVAVFAVTGIGGYYLSRPSMETLYAGLDRQDVSSIGSALHDANIPFDVTADGTAVMVHYGQTAQARMLLADKGLPHSANAGYELYDKMGSLGLTSFMQDVTRVRAIEGELARTIQTISGIRAARVHIVLPDEGSFRRSKQPPSASVVIRAATLDDTHVAQAIRHLVASAVPGMTVDEVTVLSTDGSLLASGDDTVNGAPSKELDLEKSIDRSIADSIRRTLTPTLGANNVQISVATKLNTDSRQTNETTYNPDSRVERSTRVVKESQSTQNATTTPPTTAGQNVPQNQVAPANGKQSTEDSQKREELNNYELSSKVTTTVSNGYGIDHLSVAVVINKTALLQGLGDKPTPDAVDKKLADIEALIGSAAGLQKTRGDVVKVMAADFVDSSRDLEPLPSPGFADAIVHQSGTLINALVVLAVTGVLVFFVARPLIRMLAPAAAADSIVMDDDPIMLPDPVAPTLALADGTGPGGTMQLDGWSEENLIEDVTSRPRRSPQKRLEQMIEFDEEQAAAVLKQWIHQRAAA